MPEVTQQISGNGTGTRTQVSLASNPVTFSGAQGVLKPLGLSITTEYSLQSETVIAQEET